MNIQTLQKQRRILLVDDDELILGFLQQILQHAGYETCFATSGEEALKIALEREPDLALLDVHMPNMSGLELAKYLQEQSAMPFMFLSSSVDSEVVSQAAEYGAVGYLVKPVDAVTILPAVQAALARADEIKRLKRTETNLTMALNAGRETSMAVGLLMERYRTDRETAFELLRDHARSSRRKINDVANDLLSAAEMLNQFEIPSDLRQRVR
jgi:AmiR/NasT family two-component response regulator